ncbi:MAG: septal ring lytic transglycosylase RlpA family protein [Phenylobacterium sp.]|uniref:septal ring lytic transglycosylase RlpA family protein n=1 Tax=Phenylobacterium sp. TaxID=1871053 RepID=UPI0025F8D40F|nr:septal ring lytic transglycosylase RlpA family protein [Phenylobacterium sp.]MBA4011704.1 septal ring lytic transglycosylase RlpA family protein [Phenylobacterium sp.]
MARNHSYAPVRGVLVVLVGTAALAACATPQPRYAAKHPVAGPTPGQLPNGAGGRYKVGSPYEVGGVWYVPKEDPAYDQEGTATWYGQSHHLKTTANGEVFDRYALSGAHTTLPLPSIVEVTNLENNRTVQVRVNDRGPFKGGAVIDVSQEAARQLGFEQQGTARVRVRYVGAAPLGAPDSGLRYSAYTPAPASSQLPAGPTPYAGLNPGPVQTPVASQPLAPLAPLAPVASAPLTPAPVAAAAGGGLIYRVQAGAFSDPANAQRVVSQLGSAVVAKVEPFQRADGMTLYRVMVDGTADEAAAFDLRDRVAAYGFTEARVVRPGA